MLDNTELVVDGGTQPNKGLVVDGGTQPNTELSRAGGLDRTATRKSVTTTTGMYENARNHASEPRSARCT